MTTFERHPGGDSAKVLVEVLMVELADLFPDVPRGARPELPEGVDGIFELLSVLESQVSLRAKRLVLIAIARRAIELFPSESYRTHQVTSALSEAESLVRTSRISHEDREARRDALKARSAKLDDLDLFLSDSGAFPAGGTPPWAWALYCGVQAVRAVAHHNSRLSSNINEFRTAVVRSHRARFGGSSVLFLATTYLEWFIPRVRVPFGIPNPEDFRMSAERTQVAWDAALETGAPTEGEITIADLFRARGVASLFGLPWRGETERELAKRLVLANQVPGLERTP